MKSLNLSKKEYETLSKFSKENKLKISHIKETQECPEDFNMDMDIMLSGVRDGYENLFYFKNDTFKYFFIPKSLIHLYFAEYGEKKIRYFNNKDVTETISENRYKYIDDFLKHFLVTVRGRDYLIDDIDEHELVYFIPLRKKIQLD